VPSLPDFEVFFDFYKKVFSYSERSTFEKNIDKLENSKHEISLYLDSSNNVALLNKSYSYLLDVVEAIVNSEWFKTQHGDVNSHHGSNKLHAIGSEIKPVVQQQQHQTKVHKEEPV